MTTRSLPYAHLGEALATDYFQVREQFTDEQWDHFITTRRFVDEEVLPAINDYWAADGAALAAHAPPCRPRPLRRGHHLLRVPGMSPLAPSVASSLPRTTKRTRGENHVRHRQP
jgi:hypothetical protein